MGGDEVGFVKQEEYGNLRGRGVKMKKSDSF
jgi:hypothetical protein